MSEFTPPAVRRGGEKRKGQPCIIDGCERPIHARDMCLSHYVRWRAHGDPLAGGASRGQGRKKDEPIFCEHCQKIVALATWYRHKRETSGTAILACAVEDCGEPVHSRGYCRRHYRHFSMYGDPQGHAYEPYMLTIDEKTGRLILPPSRRGGPRRDEVCLVEGCTDRARSRGLCGKHHHRWATHGDPLAGKRFHGTGPTKGYYYGPNWASQRQKARDRDGHRCQDCGKTTAEAGYSLPVHHIVPFRAFGTENYRQANQLDNLVTLCASCHTRRDKLRSTNFQQLRLDVSD